jgi:hypothetical protein
VRALSERIKSANQERLAASPPARPKPKDPSSRQRAAAYAKASVPRPELLRQRSSVKQRAGTAPPAAAGGCCGSPQQQVGRLLVVDNGRRQLLMLLSVLLQHTASRGWCTPMGASGHSLHPHTLRTRQAGAEPPQSRLLQLEQQHEQYAQQVEMIRAELARGTL